MNKNGDPQLIKRKALPTLFNGGIFQGNPTDLDDATIFLNFMMPLLNFSRGNSVRAVGFEQWKSSVFFD